MEVIGRVESGTEIECNAGTTTWMWEVEYCLEQISSSYRGRLYGCRRLKITRTNFPAVAEERKLFRNTSDREKNL